MRTAGAVIWGPPPTDKALLGALAEQASWVIQAANSPLTSGRMRPPTPFSSVSPGCSDVSPRSPPLLSRALAGRGARARRGRPVARGPRTAGLAEAARPGEGEEGCEAWAIVLGLTPASSSRFLDSVVRALPPGPEAVYGNAMLHVLKGQVAEGRRLLARTLASSGLRFDPRSRSAGSDGGDGWAALLQGDSVGGIGGCGRPGPVGGPEQRRRAAFPRLQLALALAARPETRAEGIRWLRVRLRNLSRCTSRSQSWRWGARTRRRASATRRRWRTAGFLRLWDKADPELQGRGEGGEGGVAGALSRKGQRSLALAGLDFMATV